MAGHIRRSRGGTCSSDAKAVTMTVPIWFLVMTNILVFLVTTSYDTTIEMKHKDIGLYLDSLQARKMPATTTTTNNYNYPLLIPQGTIKSQPNHISTAKASMTEIRSVMKTISPAVFKNMVTELGVKSIISVASCGISSLWFSTHGVKTIFVMDGSHSTATLPSSIDPTMTQLVKHDFSQGPWWPTDTHDAIWIDVLEHVGRSILPNYIPMFRKSAIIVATVSLTDDNGHIEVHSNEWWVQKLALHGFIYSKHLTMHLQQIAQQEQHQQVLSMFPEMYYNASLLAEHVMVFLNPAVASLPHHAHLMAEPGCYNGGAKKNETKHKKCGTLHGGDTETMLPPEFEPLTLTSIMDTTWEKQIKTIYDTPHS